ncbi:MAG: hypothetical protein QMD05_06320, partial [Candidatus Brocadiaceae bacterium]|nr:hypothetical protein [Candidatus Brocadiaceae bacterium]
YIYISRPLARLLFMMFLPPFVLILFKKLVCFLFFKELLLIFTFKAPSFLLGVALPPSLCNTQKR